jgi:hypothetical protein
MANVEIGLRKNLFNSKENLFGLITKGPFPS